MQIEEEKMEIEEEKKRLKKKEWKDVYNKQYYTNQKTEKEMLDKMHIEEQAEYNL